jgi:hypothetical protein
MNRVSEANFRRAKENELGRYPKEPNLLTMNVNFSGVLLTAQLAEEAWKSEPSAEHNRQLVLLASMGELIWSCFDAEPS